MKRFFFLIDVIICFIFYLKPFNLDYSIVSILKICPPNNCEKEESIEEKPKTLLCLVFHSNELMIRNTSVCILQARVIWNGS